MGTLVCVFAKRFCDAKCQLAEAKSVSKKIEKFFEKSVKNC